ncbi:MAG TPA: adenylyl-sulfate kinase, partial [Cyclobacteriaceae bacterium]|nr:adenylyl-sulfate kinase [Cyclobacteriaceae bacterium]
AKKMRESGSIVIAALISPFEMDRRLAKEIIGAANFIEVFVDCSLATCENRDVKGLYKKARAGQIENFTGISSPYEPPKSPDIVVRTDRSDVSVSFDELLKFLKAVV